MTLPTVQQRTQKRNLLYERLKQAIDTQIDSTGLLRYNAQFQQWMPETTPTVSDKATGAIPMVSGRATEIQPPEPPLKPPVVSIDDFKEAPRIDHSRMTDPMYVAYLKTLGYIPVNLADLTPQEAQEYEFEKSAILGKLQTPEGRAELEQRTGERIYTIGSAPPEPTLGQKIERGYKKIQQAVTQLVTPFGTPEGTPWRPPTGSPQPETALQLLAIVGNAGVMALPSIAGLRGALMTAELPTLAALRGGGAIGVIMRGVARYGLYVPAKVEGWIAEGLRWATGKTKAPFEALWKWWKEGVDEGTAQALGDVLARAARGMPVTDVDWQILQGKVNENTLRAAKKVAEELTPQIAKETQGTHSYIAKAINNLLDNTDFEILFKGHPYYPYVRQVKGLYDAGTRRIMVADRFEQTGLHELGHKVYDVDLPQSIKDTFLDEYAKFAKTRQGRVVTSRTSSKFSLDALTATQKKRYMALSRIPESQLTDAERMELNALLVAGKQRFYIKDEAELFAEVFKRAASLKSFPAFQKTISELDNWFKEGAQQVSNLPPISVLVDREGGFHPYLQEVANRIQTVVAKFLPKQGGRTLGLASLPSEGRKELLETINSMLPKASKYELTPQEAKELIKQYIQSVEGAKTAKGTFDWDALRVNKQLRAEFVRRIAENLVREDEALSDILEHLLFGGEREIREQLNLLPASERALWEETINNIQSLRLALSKITLRDVETAVDEAFVRGGTKDLIAPEKPPLDKILGGDISTAKGKPAVRSNIFTDNIQEDEVQVPWRERAEVWLQAAARQMLDDLNDIRKWEETLQKRGIDTKFNEMSIYEAFRLRQGFPGKVYAFLRVGTFRPTEVLRAKTGKKAKMPITGEPLEAILKDLKNYAEKREFDGYLATRRAYELAKQNKYPGFKPVSKMPNTPMPPAQKRMIAEQIKREKLKACQEIVAEAPKEIEAWEKDYPHFPKLAERIYQYEDRLRQYLLDAGVIDKSTYKKLAGYLSYVPFHRVLDEVVTNNLLGKTAVNIPKAIHRFSGASSDRIYSPIENIVRNTSVFISIAERNLAGLGIANVVLRNPELDLGIRRVATPITKVATVELREFKKAFGEIFEELIGDDLGKAIIDVFRPKMVTEQGVVTIRVKGKTMYFKIDDPELAKGLLNLDRTVLASWAKIFAAPASLLRTGAVLSPSFILKNPIRDQWSAFVNSNYGYFPPIDFFRGIASLVRRDDIWKLSITSGVMRSTMMSLDRDYLKLTTQQLLEKYPALKQGLNPVRALRAMTDFMEQATRVGGFKKAILKGASVPKAAMEARELTLDFQRAGILSRVLNAIIPFFNANIRDVHKFGEMMYKHPQRTMARAVLSITLPSLLLHWWNRQDPRWEHIPQYQKDLFWIFLPHVLPENWEDMTNVERDEYTESMNPMKTGIVKVPKPFLLGILFGSLPERFMDWMLEQDPTIFNEWGKNLVSVTTPGVVPQALVPIVETMTNTDLFTKLPIVPESKLSLPPEEQTTPWSTLSARILGYLLKFPPAHIDNIWNTMTGGLGKFMFQALDEVIENIVGVKPEFSQPSQPLARRPLAETFLVRNPIGMSDAKVQRFYDEMKRAEGIEAEMKKALKYSPERLDVLLAKYPEIAFYNYDGSDEPYSSTARAFRRVARLISEARNAQEDIYNSHLPPQEKQEKLEEIDYYISIVAEEFLKQYDDFKASIKASSK